MALHDNYLHSLLALLCSKSPCTNGFRICKQPMMPRSHTLKTVPKLQSLAHTAIAERRALELNHTFLRNIMTQDSCPEFHGFNTKLGREQGHLPQPKTKVLYLPLIDMKPSDPDTMLSAMKRVKELTAQTCQSFSVFTCDQQLYRVAVQISWDQPETFKDIYTCTFVLVECML